jgi:hypothetical protein
LPGWSKFPPAVEHHASGGSTSKVWERDVGHSRSLTPVRAYCRSKARRADRRLSARRGSLLGSLKGLGPLLCSQPEELVKDRASDLVITASRTANRHAIVGGWGEVLCLSCAYRTLHGRPHAKASRA